ncbi:MAG: CvpA family protein [Anaerolineales bacterium]|nr:CvpA family protein [Anaerolineales bacterium]
MVSLTFFFMCFLVLFAIVGAMRGWAKEMLVTFSVILSLFLITVLETYVGVVRDSFFRSGTQAQFWMRFVILLLLAFFGYQTPNLPKIGGARFARERLQDSLLGIFLGALNGWLIVGTLWYFMHQANYPFSSITPPLPGTPAGDAALRLLEGMAPAFLGIPYIYFAVGVAFVFVVVVFL